MDQILDASSMRLEPRFLLYPVDQITKEPT